MGWWFGRKSAPADVRPFVPAWLTSDSAEVGFARSYDAQFEEVYRRNPVGQRAVRLVAGMLGGLTVDGDARAVELVQAEGLLEGIAANLLLNGNAYVQVIADHRDDPAELCQLRPERVSVVSDERGWPVGYLYRTAGQAVRVNRLDALERRQVAHIKALHPRDDHYGMGCIEAAIGAASVHNRAAKWNKALLDNAARPSGALSYEPADGSVLSAEQFKRLKEELAAEFSGSGNVGRPLLLEGGLKWQALSLTPADMDFVALKEGAARDIALAVRRSSGGHECVRAVVGDLGSLQDGLLGAWRRARLKSHLRGAAGRWGPRRGNCRRHRRNDRRFRGAKRYWSDSRGYAPARID